MHVGERVSMENAGFGIEVNRSRTKAAVLPRGCTHSKVRAFEIKRIVTAV